MRSRFAAALLLAVLVSSGRAAIVRGRVTTAQGVPIAGARVQLIRLTGGARSVANGISGLDGRYEVRSDLAGRFLLLTAAGAPSAVQIGDSFYAGRTDALARDIALAPPALTPQVSAAAIFETLPLAERATPIAQVAADALLTRPQILTDLPANPSAFLVQLGPVGSPAQLFLRGAPPAATKTLFAGVSAEDLGGGFDLSTVAAAGLSGLHVGPALELTPTPSPLDGMDAESGLLALHPAPSSTIRPALIYTGDAGSLSSLRDEVVVSAAPTRADLYAAFSRFDTAASDTPAVPFHLSTLALNAGYHISAATSLRTLLRRDVSAAPLPVPFDFYGVQPGGKLANQNLYGSLQIDTIIARFDQSFRFGLVRKRTQLRVIGPIAQGLPVTITGANGFTATGIALFPVLPAREDFVTDRDEFSYGLSRSFRPWFRPLLTVRYQNERAADLSATDQGVALRQTLERHHFEAALAFEGELFRQRLFYEAAGFADQSPTFGLSGAPRLGITYVAVRPGSRRLHGTTLHLTAATGVREPGLRESSLRGLGVPAPGAPSLALPRARTLDLSVDQTIVPRKLTLRASYFHNQYSHEFEELSLPSQNAPPTQTSALRTQGLETTLDYQPFPRLSLRGGYSYLAALVEQSAATPFFNNRYPNTPIGGLTALAGSRPFHRPPNSGFAGAEYGGRLISFALQAVVAGRSDDSTSLIQTPGLLLPNRNLSPGYTALDLRLSYAASRRITAFTDLTNLLDNRHMAPLGYQSSPFLIRAGLRIRIGGE